MIEVGLIACNPLGIIIKNFYRLTTIQKVTK